MKTETNHTDLVSKFRNQTEVLPYRCFDNTKKLVFVSASQAVIQNDKEQIDSLIKNSQIDCDFNEKTIFVDIDTEKWGILIESLSFDGEHGDINFYKNGKEITDQGLIYYLIDRVIYYSNKNDECTAFDDQDRINQNEIIYS